MFLERFEFGGEDKVNKNGKSSQNVIDLYFKLKYKSMIKKNLLKDICCLKNIPDQKLVLKTCFQVLPVKNIHKIKKGNFLKLKISVL
jgi:hypothetical protein